VSGEGKKATKTAQDFGRKKKEAFQMHEETVAPQRRGLEEKSSERPRNVKKRGQEKKQ